MEALGLREPEADEDEPEEAPEEAEQAPAPEPPKPRRENLQKYTVQTEEQLASASEKAEADLFALV